MSMDFDSSMTKVNLMRAFAGESQARNRYTFAASKAGSQNLYVIEAVFNFTANQEKEHAEIFYNHLKSLSGEAVSDIEAGFPIDTSDSVSGLLRAAQHNEYEEYQDAYQAFGDKASEEGFIPIAQAFYKIAEIEKSHGDRFGMLADMLDEGSLFVSDVKCRWMCLNCGHIEENTSAPDLCPVCHHAQGYFIRLELAPFSS